ncbi:MAG: DNA methylase [Oscillospiraceae bacterium]|nr:DNA methylase [Oscillospiraceae bacterium]
MLPYYIAIDLKSFFASVACVDRGLDPLTTNLVVADASKTEKTICLAVTPSLKAIGVSGRPRLFEVVQQVEKANRDRLYRAPSGTFSGKSTHAPQLAQDPSLAIDYIIAPPRMARYMEVSTKIYEIYLRYIAPEDIHVYSIDEVFIDVTAYLTTYQCTPRRLALQLIRAVLQETGITATAGIGTNLFLAKVAMDIVAKKMPPDKDGVRIAALDEQTYRKQLWAHTPLTDFWRVGKGIAKKLEANHMYTMGDVAERSEYDEETLYRLFGVNAELLIDHAWGWEPCTIRDIQAYRPQTHSISRGQVLSCAYSYAKGRLIVREMTELLVLDLVEKGLVTDQLVLTVGYDHTGVPSDYSGSMVVDHYGRKLPKQAHGSKNLGRYTASARKIVEAMMQLYAQIVDETLQVRRMYVVANRVLPTGEAPKETFIQLGLFEDTTQQLAQREKEEQKEQQEHSLQLAMLKIKNRYGKNAILKGMNFLEGATTIERNGQVGGHKA